MARVISGLLRRPFPTLQQPPPRPETNWGLLQTRELCHYMDYRNNNGGQEQRRSLLDAAMVPIREDLGRLDAGARYRLEEASLVVISQLLHTPPGEVVGTTLRREISAGNKEEVRRVMDKIRCTYGPGDKKSKLAEGILTQLGTIR